MAYKNLIAQINGQLGAHGATIAVTQNIDGTGAVTVEVPTIATAITVSYSRSNCPDEVIDTIDVKYAKLSYAPKNGLNMAQVNAMDAIAPLLIRLVVMYGDFACDPDSLKVKDGRLKTPFMGLF